MSSTKVFLVSILSFIMTCFSGYGQHIDEIRKELYPNFDPIKWRQNKSIIEDYEPVDYSEWDVSPNAAEFNDAFMGYYTLEYFLSKRNSEIRKGLDEKGGADFMSVHNKWLDGVHTQCNKVWKPKELGYSMMVLEYLYCVNSKTRERVDLLGGGIPPNKRLDALAGLDRYKIGNDLSLYPDLIPDGEKDGDKIFVAKEPITVSGVDGKVKVSFHEGKLSSLHINFTRCHCNSKLYDYLKQKVGNHTSSWSDPIVSFDSYTWKGASVKLGLYYDGEEGNATILFEAMK